LSSSISQSDFSGHDQDIASIHPADWAKLVGAENRVTAADQRLRRQPASQPASQSRLAGHPAGSLDVALGLAYLILAVRREAARCRVEVRCLDHWAVAAA
jgi:hypothetical protein